MTKRGGKRPGAGRKSELTVPQMIEVGIYYESEWDKLKRQPASKAELAKAEKVRSLQEQYRDVETRLNWHKQARADRQKLISKQLDALGRTRFVVTRRPRNEGNRITDLAIDWCKKRFNIEITPRRVAECRVLLQRLKAGKPRL